MNSVERMIEYTALEPEAPAIVEARRPLPGWPQQGAIDVQQLVVRYRPKLEPVLKGISFSVRGREKVGGGSWLVQCSCSWRSSAARMHACWAAQHVRV
jgi:ABC-type multidrug transport system fused ATPase/permease subunit